MMLLSILIPTIRTRAAFLRRLLDVLEPQAADNPVVVLTDLDDGERPIGAKRQDLLDAARTDYVAFIDDDDLVSADYCRRICEAIRRDEPDFIGFRARKFVNGEPHALLAYSWMSGLKFPVEHRLRGLRKHRQTPNHLNPIRRDIALSIGFRPWNLMEDGDYATRLRKQYPLLRESFIDAYLYDYFLRTDRTGEMTNAKREAMQLSEAST